MEKKSDRVFWFDAAAWACAAVVFAPAAVWLYGALAKSGQLREAIVILVASLAVLSIEYGIRPRKPAYSAASAEWLLAGYALIFSSRYFGIWGVFPALAGFSAALTALGLACFERRRYVYAAGGSFFAFTVLSFFTPIFDMPLRVLAGGLSAKILSIFNDSVALVACAGESPQIALRVSGATYLVAAECNGFGIILGCVVLSIIGALFSEGRSVLRRVLSVAGSALVAYIMNSIRIVAIISLAPLVGMSRYHLLHETAGYVFFAIALICAWRISFPKPPRKKPASQ